MLIDEVNKYSSDEEAVVLYSAYTKEELEKNTLLEEAEELGLKRGMEEGLKQGAKNKQIEIARILLNKKMTKEEISDITQLSLEEIEKL